ncbi:MAG TPA: UvrD-helicase domain-containing protein [Candidatus Ozemobacteraceae bacterium]|nr:UvrD-helicase domain-containing protein [Candidatus Ozemobacteraceae bacterium]
MSPEEKALMQAIQGLNERQREAVELTEGPVLVIAGAGSGKTRTLTVRIANLVLHRGVPAESILAVTFTNKAAREMRERLHALMPGDASRLTVTTFHSFCCLLLRRWHKHAGFSDGFTIYDDDDQERLMKLVIKELKGDPKKFTPRFLLNLASQAKNDLIGPDEYKPSGPDRDFLGAAYRLYQQKLREHQALDFDDLLMESWKLLTQKPELLEKVQKTYQYFLVDEYQDTNFAQYKLVALLSERSRNLCVVGDDDQSIYGWRGATIRNILEFEKDFAGARVVVLDQNYRSTQAILDAASALVAKNRSCRNKKLWTDRRGGDRLRFLLASDDREEADLVVREIMRLERDGFRLQDIAILFRMNSQSRSFEQTLVKNRLPYEMTGGVKFFARREIKDVLAYLRVLANPSDAISWKRIINTPSRGIGEATVQSLEAEGVLAESIATRAKQKPESKIAVFHALMQRLRTLLDEEGVFEAARGVVRLTGYLDYLEKDDPDTAEERRENVESLLSDIRQQLELKPDLTLREYLEQTALHADVDDLDETANAVHLLTMHNAKGLEFPVVFVVGMEEGIFPHRSSSGAQEEIEEERRLAYVGMTRAMKRLYLTAARRRMMFGTWQNNALSRFLGEIPRESFEPGTMMPRVFGVSSGVDEDGEDVSIEHRLPAAGQVKPFGVPVRGGVSRGKGPTFAPLARAAASRQTGTSAPFSGKALPYPPPTTAPVYQRDADKPPLAGSPYNQAPSTARTKTAGDQSVAPRQAVPEPVAEPPTSVTAAPAAADRGRGETSTANMINCRPGVEVVHPLFGRGRILSIEGASLADFRMIIDFPRSGRKTLLLQYANLRVINNANSRGG